MEVGMRHFFAKAMHAKANKGKPQIIDANMLQAVSIAEKIARPTSTHVSISATCEMGLCQTVPDASIGSEVKCSRLVIRLISAGNKLSGMSPQRLH